MINNIIFDLGRVLINWEPEKYMKKVFDEKTISFLLEKTFNTNDWNLMDKGVIDEQTLWENKLNQYPEYKKEIEHMKNKVLDLLTPIEENAKLLYILKEKGYNLYILSNFSKIAFQKVYEKYDFFKLFDGMIISSHVKSIKPEDEIYKILIEKYKINPAESLYIDDKIENIKAGEKFGFKTIHLEKPEDLKDKLSKILKIDI
ncbi:HAD superfamily hydrolase [Thermosipho africanus TCF52B]|uniref:HAD superfamily hydrolase n=1 Tax=Thermosipho africanus (strain TCF52B) TaxID=484019 RepID=B7IHP6_THEAB|nr:HAD family phosphatase [Thermosipho africanus]ACJ75610.1 HAD superfamily hydrolase [Thermosipho africanus TCF52B]